METLPTPLSIQSCKGYDHDDHGDGGHDGDHDDDGGDGHDDDEKEVNLVQIQVDWVLWRLLGLLRSQPRHGPLRLFGKNLQIYINIFGKDIQIVMALNAYLVETAFISIFA